MTKISKDQQALRDMVANENIGEIVAYIQLTNGARVLWTSKSPTPEFLGDAAQALAGAIQAEMQKHGEPAVNEAEPQKEERRPRRGNRSIRRSLTGRALRGKRAG